MEMNMKMKIIISIIICTFCVAGGSIFAGEEIATVPRQLSLFFIARGDVKEDEKLILLQSLLIKLSEDDDINLIEPVIEKSLSSAERTEKSKGMGADCWLFAEINGVKKRLEVVYSSYDLIEEKFVILEKKYEKIRDIPNLSRIFWKNLLADVAQNYNAITARVEVKEIVKYNPGRKEVIEKKGVKVVFEARPGTKIFGIGKYPVLIDDKGLAKVECKQLTTYKIKAECTGYYPIEKRFYVEQEPVKVVLQQKPASRFAFDIYLEQSDYIGGGFIYFIIPNYFYTELSTTLFFKKLFWPVEEDQANWEAPLMHIFLALGYYFNKEDSFVRIALNSGVFIRLFFHEDLLVALEPLSGVGLRLCGVHLEVSSFPKVRFFYDHNWLIYFTDYPDLMRAAILGTSNDEGMLFGFVFGRHTVMDFLNFQIGIRILL
jgi:hypothetical protein